ncbi:MAG TPA: hypothetical protein VFF52_30140 [Isosphaeraceae bacterium]|nr:hypothetical protein [Isosphaeraceae bacterium]
MLQALGSSERIGLAAPCGRRPVVLILGNMTWGPFRSQVETLEGSACGTS